MSSKTCKKNLSEVPNNDKKNDLTFEKLPIDSYEEVWKVTSKKSGLNSIIAIHNTALGAALGGIRIFPYPSFDKALEDVLRLSKGMSYKAAAAGVGLGGGKSVIIADPRKDKTEELLLDFGSAVEHLAGKYICAEDVGCTTQDVMTIRKATKFVTGLPHEKSSGDPGPFTAWGIYRGIQAVLKKLFNSSDVHGKTIAIQGLGSVGGHLVNLLFWHGAKMVVCDIDQEKVKNYVKNYGVKSVAPNDIYSVECDIFAPCAMGGIINDDTLSKLKCKAVAGSANNQLKSDSHGEELKKQGILYAPDFVINAGGLINVTFELEKEGYCHDKALKRVSDIHDSLISIFTIAEENNISTSSAAVKMAEERLKKGIGKRDKPLYFHH